MAKGIDPTLMAELIALGNRVTEDRLYEIAVEEIERNEFDGVAKALALEEAEGHEKKSRAFYTKHRVRRIRDILAQQIIVAEQEKFSAEQAEVAAEQAEVAAEQDEIFKRGRKKWMSDLNVKYGGTKKDANKSSNSLKGIFKKWFG